MGRGDFGACWGMGAANVLDDLSVFVAGAVATAVDDVVDVVDAV